MPPKSFLPKLFLPKSFLPKAFAVILALILVALIGRPTCACRRYRRDLRRSAGLGCDAGLWCELEPGSCKRADAAGRCVHAPQVCNLAYSPVCACGGRTYGNDCERERAKAQKSHDGRCR